VDVERPAWAPDSVDIEHASPARIYDYHLGGSHNFAVDRAVAEQIAAMMPELPLIMRANRHFLRRSVRLLLDAGVRQFLDLGSGIPTVGNVHEIVQAVDGARVVYVDVDPVAVAHSRALLAGTGNAVIQADLRDVDRVLAAPEVTGLIDRTRPVGLLLVAALHFVPDADDPAGIVAGYRDAVPAGSHLVISHAEAVAAPTAGTGEAHAAYSRTVADVTLRDQAQVARFFDGFDLLAPGLVSVTDWRPEVPADPAAPRLAQLVGVGRKP